MNAGAHSGGKLCCPHSKQADRELEKNRTLPFRSFTSHC